jgi:hypothetical protein
MTFSLAAGHHGRMGLVGLRVSATPVAPTPDTVALLRSQVHQVHQLIDARMSEIVARTSFSPADHSHCLSTYAHTLCTEDIVVNLIVWGRPPVFESVWTGGRLLPWDLTSLRTYADVVYTATDMLLERLSAADLRAPVDLSDVGLGWPDVTWVLNRFILWETALACGEVAAYARAGKSRPRAGALVSPMPGGALRNGRSNGVARTSRERVGHAGD